jgi:predicted enzyme related to lactoylglutathione lyase
MELSNDLILGIDVVFLHSPHSELGDWYQEKLGLKPGYDDAHWQEFTMSQGSRFGLDFTGYPRSVIEKQAVMVSFKVADIHQAIDQLNKKGVSFAETPQGVIFDVGPALVATFQDPDGNWMQLSQRK